MKKNGLVHRKKKKLVGSKRMYIYLACEYCLPGVLFYSVKLQMIAALLFNPYLLMLFTHTLFPVILLI